MRKLLQQGLPETLLFFLVLYLVLYLQGNLPAAALPGVEPPAYLLSALIFFILGFAPGLPGLFRRIGRDGFGLHLRPLVLPGLVIVYVALLPYLTGLNNLNLPNLGLDAEPLFASQAAALWFGFLLCRSIGRQPDRPVSYLRPPYQY